MSRSASSSQRSLSLTEELERLEQSITLTLQEIDSNFSKAHRIITTSILPLVEQYGEHSKAVWEASMFWKQFFEASANVSLSGYEELANDDEPTSAVEESTVNDDTIVTAPDENATPRPRSSGYDESTLEEDNGDMSLLTDDGAGDLSGSTPRPPATKTIVRPPAPSSTSQPRFAGLSSPYEAMKREMMREADEPQGGDYEDEESSAFDESESELIFRQKTARLPDMSMSPQAFLARVAQDSPEKGGPAKDRLLHRVLDKNYRLQATPHRAMTRGTSPVRWKITENEKAGPSSGKGPEQPERQPWEDSPMSSPEMAPPTLRSAVFMSPVRAAHRTGGKLEAVSAGPRTPGVSVQTPQMGRKTRDVFQTQIGQQKDKTPAREKDEITWDSDSDDELYAGMSPPKTIQFALPASRLLQTPAREASKRIVEDILLTAGAAPDESSEYSPTIVKMNANILDDSF
ncbi:hypothetical protein MCOR07_004583 [Pyricularia oryzae]|uniref:DASH complex subunit ASK1 n=1 Tax=Pyricularia oryzae TaxID=318829 RepID=A0A4P7N421_PYROR|nr:hypothetical protein MCOR19_004971 [Pyricularia oryzae]KAI6274761.1 hypothetical protein MCOR26_006316 [Pyricularia oryzae]KAI6337270.1 hypothetical protein MCOR28_008664 [Pyricularia oryzae]KAI6369566.1 hypothetical protein MCOR31_005039 [Pyricularia oryzae]KAI6410128.1 hypothetical protein MCOR23_000645 [Pyricularia oryzae]